MTRDLFAVDPELETALDEVRRRVRRVMTGRLFIEIHRLQGATVECRIREDRTTEREIERIMREPPQVRVRTRRSG